MKRLIPLIAAIVLSFSTIACSADSSVPLEQSVSIERLSCSLPVDWAKSYGSVDTATYTPSKSDKGAFCMLFYSEEEQALLSDLSSVEEFMKKENETIVVSSIDDEEVDGFPAKRVLYDYTSSEGIDHHCLCYLVNVDGSLAVLALAAPTNEYPGYEKLFVDILETTSFSDKG